MKRDSSTLTNRIVSIVFLGCCFMLTACADARGPSWLTGEPDESIFAQPRVVAKPSGATRTEWPNLSEVPDTKPNFSDPAYRKEESTDLKSDNLKAQADMERIRNIQLYEMNMTDRTSMPPEQMLSPFSVSHP